MIFYFTGTGNSRWTAETLGKELNQRVISIAKELQEKENTCCYTVKPGELLLFVFPVHSWGPPPIVTEFIRKITLDGYKQHPVYVVCTCGDDCGYTNRIMQRALATKGWKLSGCYSVTMPNNYILMKGFDVDSKEVEVAKLAAAPRRLATIMATIRGEKNKGLYHPGKFAGIKTSLINPLFIKFALGKTAFRVTGSCISCGLCEKICPTGTVCMEAGRPVWGNSCIQCVACIHQCPVRAIEYGNETVKKGRYRHPAY
ncbi:MAG: EFR1 family ferrodoxin [Tannerellaceae bacterium]|nr:EFR1 family ferrodoxin [Tannerellaceae bacterium]